jgi:branched-chain amino acid transport system substrate-binding protein
VVRDIQPIVPPPHRQLKNLLRPVTEQRLENHQLRPLLRLLICLFIVTSTWSGAGFTAAANQPASIVLGQSCALSGPTQNHGLQMRAGLLAAFAYINERGGVKGRDIHLISLDDGYEPDKAVRNTLRLITEDKVFLLIGEVGTPTSKAVIPIVEEYRIPFFAPFTGAELLRKPFRRYIINVRASYYQEMETLAAYLVDHHHLQRIACFYQNDSYGLTGLEGIELALARRGMQLVSKGSYERNTLAVMGGIREIYQADPQAVVMVGAYPACAEFIKLSKIKLKKDVPFCNISFVGTESLKKALGAYGQNVIVSQVVPHPLNNDIALIREFRESMMIYQHDAPISFISLEGYIAGKLFAQIATAVPGELTREKSITTMQEVGGFDLGGIVLQFGPDDHQGMDSIFLTTIFPNIVKLDMMAQP